MASFFGFGSLVNCDTHIYQPLAAATVNGWKRVWVNDVHYDYAFLSVAPDPQAQIQGLLAQVPNDDWVELDKREVGYTRRALALEEWQVADTPKQAAQVVPNDVQLYVLENGQIAQPHKPILRSYLETVLTGYYEWFGAQGVEAFVESTGGWTQVLNDQSDAIYPRHVPAQGEAKPLIDATIARLSP